MIFHVNTVVAVLVKFQLALECCFEFFKAWKTHPFGKSIVDSDITTIFISEIDKNGESAVPFFDALVLGDIISFNKEADSATYAIFNFVSLIDNGSFRTLTVTHVVSKGEFAEDDVVLVDVNRVVIVTTGTKLTACPDCNGTGLDGSNGGMDGLIMAVYNGSAGWAGADIDVYGVVS